jgi:hypothetical protein
MISRCRSLSLVLALLAATTGAAFAAGGAVEGKVQDAQGKPLPGAAITLLAAGKAAQSQTTDAQGNFHFDGLTSGVYAVTAALDGYAPVACPGGRLLSGLTRRFELKLAAAGGGTVSSCVPATEPGN